MSNLPQFPQTISDPVAVSQFPGYHGHGFPPPPAGYGTAPIYHHPPAPPHAYNGGYWGQLPSYVPPPPMVYNHSGTTIVSTGGAPVAYPPILSKDKKRRRIVPACHECHLAKAKCDRKEPCTRCVKFEKDCKPHQRAGYGSLSKSEKEAAAKARSKKGETTGAPTVASKSLIKVEEHKNEEAPPILRWSEDVSQSVENDGGANSGLIVSGAVLEDYFSASASGIGSEGLNKEDQLRSAPLPRAASSLASIVTADLLEQLDVAELLSVDAVRTDGETTARKIFPVVDTDTEAVMATRDSKKSSPSVGGSGVTASGVVTGSGSALPNTAPVGLPFTFSHGAPNTPVESSSKTRRASTSAPSSSSSSPQLQPQQSMPPGYYNGGHPGSYNGGGYAAFFPPGYPPHPPPTGYYDYQPHLHSHYGMSHYPHHHHPHYPPPQPFTAAPGSAPPPANYPYTWYPAQATAAQQQQPQPQQQLPPESAQNQQQEQEQGAERRTLVPVADTAQSLAMGLERENSRSGWADLPLLLAPMRGLGVARGQLRPILPDLTHLGLIKRFVRATRWPDEVINTEAYGVVFNGIRGCLQKAQASGSSQLMSAALEVAKLVGEMLQSHEAKKKERQAVAGDEGGHTCAAESLGGGGGWLLLPPEHRCPGEGGDSSSSPLLALTRRNRALQDRDGKEEEEGKGEDAALALALSDQFVQSLCHNAFRSPETDSCALRFHKELLDTRFHEALLNDECASANSSPAAAEPSDPSSPHSSEGSSSTSSAIAAQKSGMKRMRSQGGDDTASEEGSNWVVGGGSTGAVVDGGAAAAGETEPDLDDPSEPESLEGGTRAPERGVYKFSQRNGISFIRVNDTLRRWLGLVPADLEPLPAELAPVFDDGGDELVVTQFKNNRLRFYEMFMYNMKEEEFLRGAESFQLRVRPGIPVAYCNHVVRLVRGQPMRMKAQGRIITRGTCFEFIVKYTMLGPLDDGGSAARVGDARHGGASGTGPPQQGLIPGAGVRPNIDGSTLPPSQPLPLVGPPPAHYAHHHYWPPPPYGHPPRAHPHGVPPPPHVWAPPPPHYGSAAPSGSGAGGGGNQNGHQEELDILQSFIRAPSGSDDQGEAADIVAPMPLGRQESGNSLRFSNMSADDVDLGLGIGSRQNSTDSAGGGMWLGLGSRQNSRDSFGYQSRVNSRDGGMMGLGGRAVSNESMGLGMRMSEGTALDDLLEQRLSEDLMKLDLDDLIANVGGGR